MGHFAPLSTEKGYFHSQGKKWLNKVKGNHFSPKYNFFTLKDLEMPFPLEMRGFPTVIFNKSIKKSSNDNDFVNGKPAGNKSAFHQIKNHRI